MKKRILKRALFIIVYFNIYIIKQNNIKSTKINIYEIHFITIFFDH